jgi:hypothetical protein
VSRVDCISVAPSRVRGNLSHYLSLTVRDKWRTKFGARPSAATLPAAVAVTLLKRQEYVFGALDLSKLTDTPILPAPWLWADCPGLRVAWLATPPFHSQPHRPDVFATWPRP